MLLSTSLCAGNQRRTSCMSYLDTQLPIILEPVRYAEQVNWPALRKRSRACAERRLVFLQFVQLLNFSTVPATASFRKLFRPSLRVTHSLDHTSGKKLASVGRDRRSPCLVWCCNTPQRSAVWSPDWGCTQAMQHAPY